MLFSFSSLFKFFLFRRLVCIQIILGLQQVNKRFWISLFQSYLFHLAHNRIIVVVIVVVLELLVDLGNTSVELKFALYCLPK
jgi:hypothetical protein